jgi:hypothetical protein
MLICSIDVVALGYQLFLDWYLRNLAENPVISVYHQEISRGAQFIGIQIFVQILKMNIFG